MARAAFLCKIRGQAHYWKSTVVFLSGVAGSIGAGEPVQSALLVLICCL
jgi:hypothetical protein